MARETRKKTGELEFSERMVVKNERCQWRQRERGERDAIQSWDLVMDSGSTGEDRVKPGSGTSGWGYRSTITQRGEPGEEADFWGISSFLDI